MVVAYLLAIVGVRSIEEFDAREGASELAAAGNPRDGGSLVKQEAGVEELDTLLLDESHTQDLALLLIRNQLSGQHLPCHTRLGTLHVCRTCNGVLECNIWLNIPCCVIMGGAQKHGVLQDKPGNKQHLSFVSFLVMSFAIACAIFTLSQLLQMNLTIPKASHITVKLPLC